LSKEKCVDNPPMGMFVWWSSDLKSAMHRQSIAVFHGRNASGRKQWENEWKKVEENWEKRRNSTMGEKSPSGRFLPW
jgi:hypothetical protein